MAHIHRHRIWVSIGSNVQRAQMVCAAIHDLHTSFGALVVSPVYATPAEGFDGDDFYNLVAGFDTDMPFAAMHAKLRNIEEANGRIRGANKFSPRTLDIDPLTYGNQVARFGDKMMPNREILRYAYVLKPLADVAPDDLHPELGMTYQTLWNRFQGDKTGLSMIRVDC